MLCFYPTMSERITMPVTTHLGTLVRALLFSACASLPVLAAEAIQLPALGDSESAVVSSQEEHQIGQAWLGLFRQQAPVIDDPLLQDYLEHLVYDLASHSEVQDRHFSIVIIDNKTINAFAVPGGVVGIHNGLFLQAENEDEFASVLAHELGHLSQRHFVRGLEAARAQQLPAMAGLLAGIVLAATAGPDAGMAAMMATQAAALQNQLRYSRQFEQEADRIGMQTLYASQRDPFAFVRMFEAMQRVSALSNRPPEFLLTHPVTESRIADARNRAVQLTGRMYAGNVPAGNSEYALMRARVQVHFAETPSHAVRDFRTLLESSPKPQDADRYGLALALLAAGQPREARQALAPLLATESERLTYLLLAADIDEALGEHAAALQLVAKELAINPGNHPLVMSHANLLQKQGHIQEALQELRAQSRVKAEDPALWYQLAELYGQNRQIMELHQARAEYFILNGRLDEADKQLQFALRLAAGNSRATAMIETRQQDVANLKQTIKAMRI